MYNMESSKIQAFGDILIGTFGRLLFRHIDTHFKVKAPSSIPTIWAFIRSTIPMSIGLRVDVQKV